MSAVAVAAVPKPVSMCSMPAVLVPAVLVLAVLVPAVLVLAVLVLAVMIVRGWHEVGKPVSGYILETL